MGASEEDDDEDEDDDDEASWAETAGAMTAAMLRTLRQARSGRRMKRRVSTPRISHLLLSFDDSLIC
jgi:hypothetical protein